MPDAAYIDRLAGTGITSQEIDAVLRDGGNNENSVYRVIAVMAKDKPLEETAAALREEYGQGGKGYEIGPVRLSVWFDESGMKLAHGTTATQTSTGAFLTWEDIAARIRQMLDTGHFADRVTISESRWNETRELASRLLFFYRDDLRNFREVPSEWRAYKGGFDDDVAVLRKLLNDPPELSRIIRRLSEDIAEVSPEVSAPTRFGRSSAKLLRDTTDLTIPYLTFRGARQPQPSFGRFITADEVDAFLISGGGGIQHRHTARFGDVPAQSDYQLPGITEFSVCLRCKYQV